MKQAGTHSDTSRVDTAQYVFSRDGDPNLDQPLDRKVYGDRFRIG